MNRLFYLTLAIGNIKKNGKTYIPYIITSVVTIMMFYILHSLSINEGVVDYSTSLSEILKLGVIVDGIFSTIFLFYTNSFLIKRRKKEIGLYNILGLEKKHIARILFFESTVILLITIVLGLLFGILFNKLMFLLLLNLLKLPIVLGFTISIKSLLLSVVVFLGIFLLILASNLYHIKLAKPIELLKGGQYGEREPKSKWGITILGIITLGSGYTIALSVETPLAAITLFLVAVILVMIGTYALFTSGSIVLLKLLRKNKVFFYKTRNFISISSMIYRMKQNAVGLANICILSTAVLVMLSGTVTLYIGMEDALYTRFPKDVIIFGKHLDNNEKINVNELLNEQIKNSELNVVNIVDYSIQEYYCSEYDGDFMTSESYSINNSMCMIHVVPITDFNRIEEKNITLKENELIIYTPDNTYGKNHITIDNIKYTVKNELDDFELASNISQNILDSYIIIANEIDVLGKTEYSSYVIGFDSESSDEEIIEFTDQFKKTIHENNIEVSITSVAANREGFLEITGGLFFMGIFLGTLFLMAMALIIYYKQISEGYDDKERFDIIQKVGISKYEVKNTIKSQVLLMFFFPLIFTIINIAFAFPIITKLLAILYLTNVRLYLITTICSILIFSIIYAILFLLTARTYYRIVEE